MGNVSSPTLDASRSVVSHQLENLERVDSIPGSNAQPATSGMVTPIKSSNAASLPRVFQVLNNDLVKHNLFPFLRPRDRLTFVQTSKAPREALSESKELRGALLSLAAPKVRSLEDFQAVLDEIPSLRKDLQKEPLLALIDCVREDNIYRPLENEQSAAAEAFAAAAAAFPEIQASFRAAKVKSGREFQAALDEIQKLPKELRAEPLLTLGYRILHLLWPEVEAAAIAFVSAAKELDHQHLSKSQKAAIGGLLKAAEKTGTPEPINSLFECAKQAAIADVDDGGLIYIAASRYGKCFIDELELHVINSRAGAEVRQGQRVNDVASKYGFVSELGILGLARNLNAHARKESSSDIDEVDHVFHEDPDEEVDHVVFHADPDEVPLSTAKPEVANINQ